MDRAVTLLAVPGRPVPLRVGRLPGRDDPDTLDAELDGLLASGVRRVVCLVPSAELDEIWALPGYLPAARDRFGHGFLHVPVADGDTPATGSRFEAAVAEVDRGLLAGEPAFVHCVAGCGRTGTFASCVLVRAGLTPAEAIRAFQAARRCGPEGVGQEAWVVTYARGLVQDRARHPR